MSMLGNVSRGLRETSAQIARIERDIAASPKERGLLINLSALEKRMRALELQFAELTKNDFLDVCEYKLIAHEQAEYQVSAVGSALFLFQQMVTTFFDAVKTGPKTRARISPDTASLASMNFAYSWDGSLGFTMTVPNERLIAVSSDFDMAIERAFQVVNSQEAADIAVLAKEVGIASIRSAYAWAKQHAKNRLSADVRWKRGAEVRSHTVLSVEQLAKVADLIEKTSEETVERASFAGVLNGISLPKRQFWFTPVEGDAIQGKISESLAERLSVAHPLPVPSNLHVSVTKRTRVHFSTEREEIDWELTESHPAD